MHFHISVTVSDDIDFDEKRCSTKHQCGDRQGDCDSDDECSDGLICGKDNCPAHFPSDDDCCTKAGGKIKKPNKLQVESILKI